MIIYSVLNLRKNLSSIYARFDRNDEKKEYSRYSRTQKSRDCVYILNH